MAQRQSGGTCTAGSSGVLKALHADCRSPLTMHSFRRWWSPNLCVHGDEVAKEEMLVFGMSSLLNHFIFSWEVQLKISGICVKSSWVQAR